MIKFTLDPGAYAPKRAHEDDAGWDLRTRTPFALFGHSHIAIDTGVHIQIPRGCVGFVKSKSGLNFARNITTDGTIDAGYTGSIKVKLYNNGNQDVFFSEGDKIAQIVVLPIISDKMIQVDSLEDTARGNNGFGSTGR